MLSAVLLTGLTVVAARDVPAAAPQDVAQAQAPRTTAPAVQAPAAHRPSTRTPAAPNPDPKLYDAAMAAAELPPGGRFTERGAGRWRTVEGRGKAVGGPARTTYAVEVEEGVELLGGPAVFAADVDTILADPRGWTADGQQGFQRVDTGDPDLRIRLTSQLTTREVCGWAIKFEGSCVVDDVVIINVARWTRGAVSFQGSLVEYKHYVVNHEVGHGLGHNHRPCQKSGALAPVMMQQSWGVSNDYLAALGTDRVTADGKVCKPNAYPYPTGKA